LAVCFFYNFLFAANETIRKFEKSIFIENDDSTAIFAVVEKMPQFPGGEEEMILFFDQNILKPDIVKDGTLEGSVYLSIVIDRHGKVQNPKIMKGICRACDDEVLRVVNLMPDWIPGEQKGENVNVQIVIPIRFSKDSREIQLYKLGVKSFENGDFKMADSLYTRVIRINPQNNNAYYNRAVTRFSLGNEFGFCKDMYHASKLEDKEAIAKYEEHCIKHDSLVKIVYKKEQQAKELFTLVETMPEFPGGQENMFRFIGQNIKYPIKAKDYGVTGIVYVTFIIDSDGKVFGAKILRGISPECDAEALRVINMMPDWKPGTQKGKNVNVQCNLPIKFSLINNR